MRPVTYADYRNHILTISPTFGQLKPMLEECRLYFATAAQMWHEAEAQGDADSSSYLMDLLGREPLLTPAPLVVEPAPVEPLAVAELVLGVEEFQVDPYSQHLLVPSAITVREAVELLERFFIPGEKPVGAEGDMNLTDFFHSTLARRKARAGRKANSPTALPALIALLPTDE